MVSYGHYTFSMNIYFEEESMLIFILFVIRTLLINQYYLLTSFAFHSDRLKGYEERIIRSVHALLDAALFPCHMLLGRFDHNQLRRWNKLKIYWLHIYSERTALKTKSAKTDSMIQTPWKPEINNLSRVINMLIKLFVIGPYPESVKSHPQSHILGFLIMSITQYSKNYKTHCFRTWNCFRPKVGREIQLLWWTVNEVSCPPLLNLSCILLPSVFLKLPYEFISFKHVTGPRYFTFPDLFLLILVKTEN
jgi:hypothetical protein